MEEQLIEAVRVFPLIYDKSLREFRDEGKKQKAWKEVAAAVGVEETLCQSRWRSLCDRYVREVEKIPASGSGAVADAPKWRYMEAMSFLKGYCCPRKTFGNTKEEASDSSSSWFDESDEETLEVDEELQESETLKRKKIRKVAVEESFSELYYVVRDLICSQAKASVPESRNAAFLRMLDSYLIKLPESVQDRIKVKLLCEVQNEIEKLE